MKHLWVVVLLAEAALASDVTVLTSGDTVFPNSVSLRAKTEVSELYARIGVRLNWKRGIPARNDGRTAGKALHAVFLARTPDSFHPGVLAFAQPFDAVPVLTVLSDRIQAVAERRPAIRTSLLAHVLAHEIAHLLARSTAHAESGLMKAQWGEADYLEMGKRQMQFTPLDITWIAVGQNVTRCGCNEHEAPQDKGRSQQTSVTPCER
jgi:hypothetical protein